MIKFNIYIRLKDGVLDPQGKAINHALHALEFDSVVDVRVNKMITLSLEGKDKKSGLIEVEKMCEELLANTVIEDYRIESVE